MDRTMRCFVALAAVSICCLSLAGCSFQPIYQATRESTTAHVLESALDVETNNGSITVIRADRTDVEIIAHLKANSQERLDATKIVAERVMGGELRVRVEWPGGVRQNREGCSFEIAVPSASGVVLKGSNGAQKIQGLTGTARLSTSNGTVSVAHHVGDINIESSNGRITAEQIDGSIDARTSNGQIEIREANSSINVHSSNGQIAITMTADATGPVQASTSNGAIKLSVGAQFAGSLNASTSNGNITVSDELQDRVVSQEKNSAELRLSSAAQNSTLETSNGSISIQLIEPAIEPTSDKNQTDGEL